MNYKIERTKFFLKNSVVYNNKLFLTILLKALEKYTNTKQTLKYFHIPWKKPKLDLHIAAPAPTSKTIEKLPWTWK